MTAPPIKAPHLLNPRSPAFGYLILGGICLGVLLLVLAQQGQSVWVTWPLLVLGAGGLVTRMRLSPPVILVLVAFSQAYFEIFVSQEPDRELGFAIRIQDILLGAAMLGFVACHYRLQGVSRSVFPLDPRFGPSLAAQPLPGAHSRSAVHGRRSARLVTPAELAVLAASLQFWALAAHLVWFWVAQPRNVLDWGTRMVQLTVCVVALGPGLMVAAALLDHFRRRRMTHQEATLLLQDTLWNETRGEQRWFTRWLAWFWLQRKEQS